MTRDLDNTLTSLFIIFIYDFIYLTIIIYYFDWLTCLTLDLYDTLLWMIYDCYSLVWLFIFIFIYLFVYCLYFIFNFLIIIYLRSFCLITIAIYCAVLVDCMKKIVVRALPPTPLKLIFNGHLF